MQCKWVKSDPMSKVKCCVRREGRWKIGVWQKEGIERGDVCRPQIRVRQTWSTTSKWRTQEAVPAASTKDFPSAVRCSTGEVGRIGEREGGKRSKWRVLDLEKETAFSEKKVETMGYVVSSNYKGKNPMTRTQWRCYQRNKNLGKRLRLHTWSLSKPLDKRGRFQRQ